MRFAVKQRFVVVFYALLFDNWVKVFIKSNYIFFDPMILQDIYSFYFKSSE